MRFTKITSTVLFCFAGSALGAQTSITSCIETQNAAERLACFDSVFPVPIDDGEDAAAWAVYKNTLLSMDDLLNIARPISAGQARNSDDDLAVAEAEAQAAEAAALAEAAAAEEAALAAAAAAEAAALAEAENAEAVVDNQLEQTAPTTVDTGKWNVRNDVSALTDDRNVFLTLRSENTIRGRFSGAGRGTLLIRCMENTTTAYLNFNEHHMADLQNYGRVEYRIDDAPMRSINMNESTDNRVLGLWSGGRSIPWIKDFIDADQLIVRATPFSESAITMTFDVRGLDTAILGLRETCSW